MTTKMLAGRLGVGPSTVSETVRRLADSGLVTHQPYGAVELTADGERHALAVVRRHRLIETFLVEVLGYGWDEVHDEAEVLEHAVSDLFVERIAAQLGHPRRDPHGDPIPGADGSLDIPAASVLWDVEPGEWAVARISDADPELLRYLESVGLVLDAPLRRRRAPDGRRRHLGAGRGAHGRPRRGGGPRHLAGPRRLTPVGWAASTGADDDALRTEIESIRPEARRWSPSRPRARAPRCSRSRSAGSASAPPSSRRWACCPRSPTTSRSPSRRPATRSPPTRSASSSAPRRSPRSAPGSTAAGSCCCSWSRSPSATCCPRSRRRRAGWCSRGSSPGCRTGRSSGSARSWGPPSSDRSGGAGRSPR